MKARNFKFRQEGGNKKYFLNPDNPNACFCVFNKNTFLVYQVHKGEYSLYSKGDLSDALLQAKWIEVKERMVEMLGFGKFFKKQ